jgi:DNA polymerase delta subunit 1
MKRLLSEGGEQGEEAKWRRDRLPPDFSAETHGVTLQVMDVKYVIEAERPVVKMYGCSQEGYSVALSVHNFMPYLYAPVPCAVADPAVTCAAFLKALNTRLREKIGEAKVTGPCVLCVDIVQKTPIMYYQESPMPFFKITLSSPKHVPPARAILEDELQAFAVPGLGAHIYSTYESNIAYVVRFMVDTGLSGAAWVHMPAGKYELVEEEPATSTTIEAAISYENLVVYSVDDEKWSHSAPLRTLSFDIECAGRPGSFPDPQLDPVIQIANHVTVVGQEKPLVVNIFVLGTCTPISGVDVRCFRTEAALLTAWSQFVVTLDPDLLTGYNIVNFDLDYLTKRAEALKLRDFACFSRLLGKRISAKDSKFSSAQTGSRESKEWFIDGRIVFDMYQVIQRDYKLGSYTLNNVAKHFLDQQKEDVHHSQITKLHQGTADDRRRLAVYCCKDALLPQRLIENRMSLVNYVEMARVTGVPFSFLLTRGQSVKVMSQILRKAREMELLIPVAKGGAVEGGFQGAKVFDPKVGFYDKPIPTLDFASLYPSIMQAHNLCFTTLLRKGVEYPSLQEGVHYKTSPMGDRFVLATTKKGILPLILEQLLAARGRAKKLMVAATDPAKEKVYNARQLALKVSANSVYGFTGQAVGSLPCLEISSTVTSYGREMILLTAETVQEHYSIRNGYEHDAQVIYGDTDSVMVHFGVSTVAEAIRLGLEAAQLVSAKFLKPIKLEFEKVYYPYLLMSKKKYAGMFWTKPDKPDKMDCKGIESVRRDNCGIVRYAVDRVLHKILEQQDIAGSVAFCKGIISEILQNRIDLSLLIITKAYSRDADAYKSPQAHIVLAQKMAQRNPATAPVVGDRIPYVIVKGDKKAKMFEKAEDPLYVLENDVPIDAQYYIDQLISPLCRILTPVIENPESLLTTGEHTRHVVIPRPKNVTAGGLGQFLVVRENCLGCKTPLQKDERALCRHCRPNAADIYVRHLDTVREKEMEFGRLWTQCQQCQGNVHLEVVCSANDCAIFYKRTKAHKENVEAQKALARFDLLEW